MAGIRVEGCHDVTINDSKFINCDIAIHASNTNNLKVNKLSIIDCEKGIGLYECRDSQINDVNIHQPLVKTSRPSNLFKLTKLTSLIKYYMIYG